MVKQLFLSKRLRLPLRGASAPRGAALLHPLRVPPQRSVARQRGRGAVGGGGACPERRVGAEVQREHGAASPQQPHLHARLSTAAGAARARAARGAGGGGRVETTAPRVMSFGMGMSDGADGHRMGALEDSARESSKARSEAWRYLRARKRLSTSTVHDSTEHT